MLSLIFYFLYNIAQVKNDTNPYCQTCEVEKQQVLFHKKELRCLAEAIYFESRSIGTNGMAMVAQATLNRSKSSIGYGSVCDTVYVPSIYKNLYGACAYSFTCDKKTERMSEPRARQKALTVATNALNGKYKHLTRGTHFVSCEVAKTQSWVRNMKPAGTDGYHCYYY